MLETRVVPGVFGCFLPFPGRSFTGQRPSHNVVLVVAMFHLTMELLEKRLLFLSLLFGFVTFSHQNKSEIPRVCTLR